MKSALKTSVQALAMATCCFVALSQNVSLAGESIIIGNSKERVEPGKENKPETGLFGKSIGKAGNTDPLQSMPSLTPPSQSRNSKQEKRMQNKADEKANWLLLNEGDLTGGEDETFGVDDKAYSADGLDKKDTSRNYTFYSLTKQNRNDGKPSPQLLRQMQKSKQDRDLSSSFEKSDRPSGNLHTANELNFHKMFEPGRAQNGQLGLPKSDPSMQGLFNSPTPAFDHKAQANHRDRFNDFLKGPASSSASSSPDYTRRAPANNPIFSPPAAGQALPSFSAPSSDASFGRANPFSAAPPAATYREPARNFPPPSSEPPRRSF